MRLITCLMLSVFVTAVIFVVGVPRTSPLEFSSSIDLRAFVARNGFHIHDERDDVGNTCASFLISDRALTDEEILAVSTCSQCGAAPHWNGIVKATQIHSTWGDLLPSSVWGNTRIWGNVLAAGDEKLLNLIERMNHVSVDQVIGGR